MAENKRELTVSVGVDVTDAIKALKAVQREAKEATRALRELESARAEVIEGERVIPIEDLKARLSRLDCLSTTTINKD